jgi:hypothetical protein
MKIRISKRQFRLLLDQFHLIGDRGLNITMSGKSAKALSENEQVLIENRQYKVHFWIGGLSSYVVIPSPTGAYAMDIVSKLYPKAQVYSATEIKGKLC